MTQTPDNTHPCRLYLISPPKFELDIFAEQLDQALSAGDVGAFQLRLKESSDTEILAACKKLYPICRAYDVAFILNDRADLALIAEVDGVHLGQDDGLIADARRLLGEDAVIGATCHASGHMAMEAGDQGADYVAFGAFFETTSKSKEKQEKYGRPDLALLSWWATYTVLPSVAIGGLTPQNCRPLVAAGADFIAAITAVWQHPEGVKTAVREFNEAIKQGVRDRVKMIQNDDKALA